MNDLESRSKKEQKILNISFDIVHNEPEEIGFVFRSMVSASLHHSKPLRLTHIRSSHNFIISIIGNREAGGIPYGTYPRLILSWVDSEIVKKQSREYVL